MRGRSCWRLATPWQIKRKRSARQCPTEHIRSRRNTDRKSLARKCEKTVHPVATAERRSALCLKSPLKSVLSTSTRHNSKTIELSPYIGLTNLGLPYVKFNIFSLQKCSSSMNFLALLRRRLVFKDRLIILWYSPWVIWRHCEALLRPRTDEWSRRTTTEHHQTF